MQCIIGLGCHKGDFKKFKSKVSFLSEKHKKNFQNKVAFGKVMTQKIAANIEGTKFSVKVDFWCGWVSEEIEKKLKIANNCSKIPWENI